MSEEDLSDRLREHSSLFSSMVELIPAKYYVMKDYDEDLTVNSTKFHQNRSSKTPRQAVKEATKRAKKLKLDPAAQKSIRQLQSEAAEKEANEESGATGSEAVSVEKIKSVNLEELRERLRNKLDELGSRSKKSAKKIEGEGGKKLTKTKVDKSKKTRSNQRDGRSMHSCRSLRGDRKSVLSSDKDGTTIFSKFDFSTGDVGEWKCRQKKPSCKKLLRQAQEKHKQMEDLASTDKRKAEQLQEKDKWRQAIDKAVGTKKKDNPKLLRKTVKRQEKKKQRSQQKWQEEKERQDERKRKVQTRREKHLQERIDQKKAKGHGKMRHSKQKIMH